MKILQNDKLIQKNTAEGLIINSLQALRFYTQPKIHKEGNPGRPVIGSVTCCRSKIPEYVDYNLQPVLKQIRSYVNDTNNIVSKLKAVETVPDNSYLVSLDVKSLYTNIPISEGIKAVKTRIENFP